MTHADSTQIDLISVPSRYGIFCFPASDTIIGRSLSLYGEWAAIELDHMARFIPTGGTVLDVGACYGTHTLAFAAMVGPEGQVVAFEASEINFDYLKRNVETFNGHGAVTLIQGIVGSETDVGYRIQHNDENRGGTSISRAEPDAPREPGQGTTLDSLGLERVDFIKIDVEGMEAQVLQGATRLLATQRPVVFFEVNTVAGAVETMARFEGQGYAFYGDATPAYNPENFFGNAENIFGDARECGIFAIPEEALDLFEASIRSLSLPPITTADDVVLMLLHKPQYFGEVLTQRPATSSFPAPISTLMADDSRAADQADSARGATFHSMAGRRELLVALHNRESEMERLTQDIADLKAELSRRTQQTDHALTALKNSLGAEIDRLNQLLGLAKMLARGARRFPFSLYFRTKKKYRRALRTLLSAAPGAMSPVQQEAAPAQDDAHPAGYKAEILRHLQVKRAPQAVMEREPPQVWTSADALLNMCRAPKGLILSFSHDNYLAITGGTQLCVGIEQAEAQSAGFDYLHLFPQRHISALAPEASELAPMLGVSLNGTPLGVTSYAMVAEVARRRAQQGANPHVVVHHLLSHAPEAIAAIVQATGQERCTVWLHDFFTLCVSPHLLRNNVTFCGAPDPHSASCGICAYGEARPDHLRRVQHMFAAVQVDLVTPSAFVADLFRERAPLPYATLSVQPHLELSVVPEPDRSRPPNGPIRVAFIGAPADHKGWQNFRAAATRFGRSGRYEFMYFGSHTVDPDIRSIHVATSAQDRLAMVSALRDAMVDVVIHISPTPETFSFTTHEAFAAGAHVLTNSGSGNTAQVVRNLQRGLVVDRESDLEAAFDSGEIARLAQSARERRGRERVDVRFSRMSLATLAPEERV